MKSFWSARLITWAGRFSWLVTRKRRFPCLLIGRRRQGARPEDR